jgi:hypothetical protein
MMFRLGLPNITSQQPTCSAGGVRLCFYVLLASYVAVTAAVRLQASGEALFAGDVAARMKRGVLYLASEYSKLAGPVVTSDVDTSAS